MNAAKEAAKNFLHRDKKHDTEVREAFKPAVTKETIVPIEKVEEVVAVDREIHQDHYQTRIQPIEDKVYAPEKHQHVVAPVIHREHHEGSHNPDLVKQKLNSEIEQLKSTTTVLPTTKTKTEAGVLQAEHVHHHVYEVVQPVIEREVVQPTVVHTTVPVHEVIHHEATVHPATVQPKMTLEEFRRAGGVLEGKPEIRDVFPGEPQIRENGGAQQTHPNARVHGNYTSEKPGLARNNSTDSSLHDRARPVNVH
jgi:hypothetical protein